MTSQALTIQHGQYVGNLPAVVPPERELLPAKEVLGSMYKVAQTLVGSGFLPQAITTPEAAFAIMLKGRELGIPTMASFAGISIIQGKPSCGAELMAALIYRDHGDDALRVIESTADRCEIEYRRRGWATSSRHSFTVEDARRANLLDGRNKDTWAKWLPNMLRARCISQIGRMAFPDSIGGMHLPAEIATGELEDAEVPLIGTPPSAQARPALTVVQQDTPPAPAAPIPAAAAGTGQPAAPQTEQQQALAFALRAYRAFKAPDMAAPPVPRDAGEELVQLQQVARALQEEDLHAPDAPITPEQAALLKETKAAARALGIPAPAFTLKTPQGEAFAALLRLRAEIGAARAAAAPAGAADDDEEEIPL